VRSLWLLLHVLGFAAWIGGALAVMAIGVAVKRERGDYLGVAVRLQGAVYRAVVGPGALAVTVSGFILTLQLYNQAASVGLSPWLMGMQGVGLVAALIVFLAVLPTALKLTRLEPTGSTAEAFQALRRRQVMAGMASSTLALLALVLGVLARAG
jgi:hypothetical protein